MSGDPIAFVSEQLSDLPGLLAGAGIDDDCVAATDCDEMREAVPEIVAALPTAQSGAHRGAGDRTLAEQAPACARAGCSAFGCANWEFADWHIGNWYTGAVNPFHYGTPVEGEFFTGRRAELDALVARMRDGINVVLVSPRRYGKTSLHRAAQARLSAGRARAAVIEVNLLRAGSPVRLAGMLAAGAFHLPGGHWARARQALPEFLRRLHVAPMVTFDPAGNPRFGFDTALGGAELDLVLADVYALLAEMRGKRPAVLILDEFQAVDLVGPELPRVLKGLADDYASVSLVLAGSKRHLMERLFTDREAPLYGMCQRLALGPIPETEIIPYLVTRAAAGGRSMDEATAAEIVAFAGPVPNDIQHLAYDAFEAATDGIDRTAVLSGMSRAVAHDAALFADALGRLSPGQARLLTALARHPPDEPYSASFARRVGLATGSSVRKALLPLLANDDVVERDGRLVVADPFFAAWLREEG